MRMPQVGQDRRRVGPPPPNTRGTRGDIISGRVGGSIPIPYGQVVRGPHRGIA